MTALFFVSDKVFSTIATSAKKVLYTYIYTSPFSYSHQKYFFKFTLLSNYQFLFQSLFEETSFSLSNLQTEFFISKRY